MVGEEVAGVLESLPVELAGRIDFIIQAIGGVIVIYLIFALIRFYTLRKQMKIINEINKDVKNIKKILKGKKIK